MNLLEDVENLIHHHPEGDTVTDQTVEDTGPAQGESIAEEAEDHVKQIIAWGQRFIAQGLPALKAKAAADAQALTARVTELEGHPAVKLLEGLLPEQAQAVLKIMGDVVAAIGAVAADVAQPDGAATPEAPAEPAAQPQ